MKLLVAVNQENIHLLDEIGRAGADGFLAHVGAGAPQEPVFTSIGLFLKSSPSTKIALMIEDQTLTIGKFPQSSKTVIIGEEFRFIRGSASADPETYVPFLLHGAEFKLLPGICLVANEIIFEITVAYSQNEFVAQAKAPGVLYKNSIFRVELSPAVGRSLAYENNSAVHFDFIIRPLNSILTGGSNTQTDNKKPTLLLAKITTLLPDSERDLLLERVHGLFIDRKEISVNENAGRLGLWQKSLVAASHRRGKFTMLSGGVLEHLPANDAPYASDVLDITGAALDGVSALVLHSPREHLVRATAIARGIIDAIL